MLNSKHIHQKLLRDVVVAIVGVHNYKKGDNFQYTLYKITELSSSLIKSILLLHGPYPQ